MGMFLQSYGNVILPAASSSPSGPRCVPSSVAPSPPGPPSPTERSVGRNTAGTIFIRGGIHLRCWSVRLKLTPCAALRGRLIIALTARNQLRRKSLLVWHNRSSPTDRYQSNHMMRMDQSGVTSHHSIISINIIFIIPSGFSCFVQSYEMFGQETMTSTVSVCFLGQVSKARTIISGPLMIAVAAGLPDDCRVNPTNQTTWTVTR